MKKEAKMKLNAKGIKHFTLPSDELLLFENWLIVPLFCIYDCLLNNSNRLYLSNLSTMERPSRAHLHKWFNFIIMAHPTTEQAKAHHGN